MTRESLVMALLCGLCFGFLGGIAFVELLRWSLS